MDGVQYSSAPCGPIEIRQRGDGTRRMRGQFQYGRTATISDRGRGARTPRKETVRAGAFAFAIKEHQRRIDLLSGHQYDKPLANTANGTLKIKDTKKSLQFEVEFPPIDAGLPSYVEDTISAVRNGLATGVSPGWRVPPRDVVPDAIRMIPEPGNPGVYIRQIRNVVLVELSIVTRPAYPDDGAFAEMRAAGGIRRRGRFWRAAAWR